jgi:serine/threonine protein kinase
MSGPAPRQPGNVAPSAPGTDRRQADTAAAPATARDIGSSEGTPVDSSLPDPQAAKAPVIPPALQGDRLQLPDYEILEELGRGNMGIIYKARQTKLNRVVAIKMILAGSSADQKQLRRFQTEAEAVGKVHHPNIVQIYSMGEHEGMPYLVMEYVDGGSLDKKLRGRTLPPKQAAMLIQRLARAIQAAHDHGIIHRDLKPGNILLSAKGNPKITDFGLAKRLDEELSHTATGTILGTPSYMSPEQARANKLPVSAATDVYGLGAIMYELLTGRPPFRAETFLDTMLQVVSMPPVPPSKINPRVPVMLEAICLKCLMKDPTDRYLTASALADALGQYLANPDAQVPAANAPAPTIEETDEHVVDLASAQSISVHLTPMGSMRHLLKKAGGSPILTAASLFTFGILLAVLFGLTMFWHPGSHPLVVVPLAAAFAALVPTFPVLATGLLVVVGDLALAYTQQSPFIIAAILMGMVCAGAARGLAFLLNRPPLPGLLGGIWGFAAGLGLLWYAKFPINALARWSTPTDLFMILASCLGATVLGATIATFLAPPLPPETDSFSRYDR